ncbi:MAG: hypothetical protein K5839_03810 [Treponemataceae bacterium]|nr:hypothetical protein [Treponemataceae bacterium]
MEKNDSLFAEPGKAEQAIINNFDQILQGIRPLSSKQIYQLPDNIKELSHLLTDERTNRRNGYMNETLMLSAYTHYFMWWNLFRLTHLFAGFPKEAFANLKDGSYCLDLGSGPLTLVCALYLARPELRSRKLVWYCMDISQNSLALGEEIFLSICARLSNIDSSDEPWKIIRVKGEYGTKIKNKADLVTCANMFNELYYDTKMTLEEAAKKYTASLLNYCTENASALIIEPAFPRSSRFISLTRDALLRKKFTILSPCLHSESCPMDGRKGGKWCHFVLDTQTAPKKLHALSAKSKLAKDRANLSFVFATNSAAIQKPEEKNGILNLRISSDEIILPGNRFGRYCCSKLGLVLLTGEKNISSGDVYSVLENKAHKKNQQIDRKSGALVIEAK